MATPPPDLVDERPPKIERDGDSLIIRIPMALKKRGGRKEIILPAGFPEGGMPSCPAKEPLVTALARAFHWQELIDDGRYGSITELADAMKVDRSYVRRILRLALLAPDIVETILRGKEPSGLSLERLVSRLPIRWDEQRTMLGFPAAT